MKIRQVPLQLFLFVSERGALRHAAASDLATLLRPGDLVVANDAASYRYLAESIRVHPDQRELKALMERSGFDRVDYYNLVAGVVALHVGWVY